MQVKNSMLGTTALTMPVGGLIATLDKLGRVDPKEDTINHNKVDIDRGALYVLGDILGKAINIAELPERERAHMRAAFVAACGRVDPSILHSEWYGRTIRVFDWGEDNVTPLTGQRQSAVHAGMGNGHSPDFKPAA